MVSAFFWGENPQLSVFPEEGYDLKEMKGGGDDTVSDEGALSRSPGASANPFLTARHAAFRPQHQRPQCRYGDHPCGSASHARGEDIS